MSKKKAAEDYEIGYGRPPKHTQFQKGGSGNPKGRPKKLLNFEEQLLRVASTPVTITENGRRVSKPRYDVAMLQLVTKAMAGDMKALNKFFDLFPRALDKAALAAANQSNNLPKYKKADDYTDDELAMIIWEGQQNEKKEREREEKKERERLILE
jgi:hypothetical protein